MFVSKTSICDDVHILTKTTLGVAWDLNTHFNTKKYVLRIDIKLLID